MSTSPSRPSHFSERLSPRCQSIALAPWTLTPSLSGRAWPDWSAAGELVERGNTVLVVEQENGPPTGWSGVLVFWRAVLRRQSRTAPGRRVGGRRWPRPRLLRGAARRRGEAVDLRLVTTRSSRRRTSAARRIQRLPPHSKHRRPGQSEARVRDATAGPRHTTRGDGYQAALINYPYLAHAVVSTEEIVNAMSASTPKHQTQQHKSEPSLGTRLRTTADKVLTRTTLLWR